MPLYVRAGAIVPMQTLVQYTGEIRRRIKAAGYSRSGL